MTPEEFAAQTGLSLEEAEMVLRRRAEKEGRPFHGLARDVGGERFQRAMEILRRAEKKVGVKPYEESK